MTDQIPQVEDSLTYIAEDITTLRDLVQRLRSIADTYDRLQSRGWELVSPVDHGRLYLAQSGA